MCGRRATFPALSGKDHFVSQLARFRQHKNSYFKEHEHSPLTPEQQESFIGLDYFPENEALIFVVALEQGEAQPSRMALDTTTGDTREYGVAGLARLEIEGQPVTLTVLREPGRGRYFLPFRDATSGDETYELGRYLDPQERPDGRLIIDFNHAYNPYCAYGDSWSCPVPPAENRLSVPIRAGERTFGDA